VADDELGRLDRVRLHRKLGPEMGLKAIEQQVGDRLTPQDRRGDSQDRKDAAGHGVAGDGGQKDVYHRAKWDQMVDFFYLLRKQQGKESMTL